MYGRELCGPTRLADRERITGKYMSRYQTRVAIPINATGVQGR